MFSAAGGGATVAAALSCAAAGAAASRAAATTPECTTNALKLLAKSSNPCRFAAAFGPLRARHQALGGSGCVDQHQLRVVLGFDAQVVFAPDGNSIARIGGDAVHPDPAARHQVKVPFGIGRKLDGAASLH